MREKKVVEKHETNERDRPTPPKNEMKKIRAEGGEDEMKIEIEIT